MIAPHWWKQSDAAPSPRVSRSPHLSEGRGKSNHGNRIPFPFYFPFDFLRSSFLPIFVGFFCEGGRVNAFSHTAFFFSLISSLPDPRRCGAVFDAPWPLKEKCFLSMQIKSERLSRDFLQRKAKPPHTIKAKEGERRPCRERERV